jgi:hypothetical protein
VHFKNLPRDCHRAITIVENTSVPVLALIRVDCTWVKVYSSWMRRSDEVSVVFLNKVCIFQMHVKILQLLVSAVEALIVATQMAFDL